MRRAVLFLAALAAVPATGQQPQLPKVAPGAPDLARVKAGTYVADAAHTQILYRVNHMGFSDFYGIFPNATGTLTIDPARPSAASVTIIIPVADVSSASPKLDEHLRKPDFFDTAKFPTASFRSTRVAVSGKTARITGDLTVHGVTKPVVLDARFIGAGDDMMSRKPALGFAATTTIRRSDFGLGYGIPLVSDTVELKINVAFTRQ